MSMRTVSLQLDNMHCGACVRRVSQVLNGLPSTHAEEVRVGSARVQTDRTDAELTNALGAAGFPAHSESSQP